METTIALYSHDSVGLGHARRNRALAYALAQHLPDRLGGSVRGLLIAGHPDAGRDPLPDGWDWLILPGLTRGPGGTVPRRMGGDAEDIRALRAATARAALTALRPDLLIVDRHPFGIDGELLPALRDLRAQGCAIVLGLREVLDAPEPAALEWERLGGAEHVAHHLDAVWVYGDAQVYDPRLTGELPGALAHLATTTGYLGHGRPPAPRGERLPAGDGGPRAPYILTVLGGGSDGAELARVAAAAEPPAGHHHLLVTGPQMAEEDIAEVRSIARPGTSVVRSAADVPELIAEASAVVSMAGYNTLAELLVTSTPALVVPRTRRRQEQPRRARALAALGAVTTHGIDTLTPAAVTDWWRQAVATRCDRTGIDLGGLTVVPRLAAELLGHGAATGRTAAGRAGSGRRIASRRAAGRQGVRAVAV